MSQRGPFRGSFHAKPRPAGEVVASASPEGPVTIMLRRVASRTQHRGGPDTARRRFRIALLFAALLHLPAFPQLGLLAGLARSLQGPGADWDYDDGEVVIPVMLEEEPVIVAPEPPAAAPQPAVEDAKEAEPATPEAKKRPTPEGDLDAGVPDASSLDSEDELDAGAVLDAADALDAGMAPDAADDLDAADGGSPMDAGPSDADVSEGDGSADQDALDAGVGGVALADAGASQSVKDTLGLTGGLTKIVKGKPNIALVLWFDAIREQPLGATVSEILQCEPQWRDFLGGSIDPVRDFEGVMITGPRFSDSSKITVAVQHRLSKDRVRELVGSMVARSGDAGAFLDAGTDEIVAQAFADRAERVVFTHPRDMVFITPPEGYEQLRSVEQALSLPAGEGRAISLTLVDPIRPLRAFRVQAPETLTELRLDVFVGNDGGATINAEFDDKDEETAKASAKTLTEQLARSAVGPFVGNREFVAQGSRVVGTLRLSRLTSALVLGFVRAAACPTAPAGGP